MDTAQKISDSKIAIEDLIKDLESVADRAYKSRIRKPAREIDAESNELFQVLPVS